MKSKLEILKDYENPELEEIYIGGKVRVYKVTYGKEKNKKFLTLKILKLSNDPLEVDGATKSFSEETTALEQLKHPNIIGIIKKNVRKVEESGELFGELLMEYGGKSLQVEKAEKLDEDTIVKWALQSASAFAFAESKGIYHGDIKPKNITINSNGDLKVIDFGISVILRKTLILKSTWVAPVKGLTKVYSAPEFNQDGEKKTLVKMDVYSWGLTFYVVICKKNEKEILTEYNNKMKSEKYHDNFVVAAKSAMEAKINKLFAKIIMECLERDPKKRPTFTELYEKLLKYQYQDKVSAKLVTAEDQKESPKKEEIKKDYVIAEISPERKKLIDNETTGTTFDLKEKSITDAECEYIAQRIAIMGDKLTILYLNENQIGDKGIIKIANALKGKTQLTKLWAHKNKIGDDGAIALGDSLISHDKITVLLLNDNQIGDKGIIKIGNALKGKTQLTELWVHNNKIRDDGAVALGDALISHDQITDLRINNNQIGDKGIIKIANALKGKIQLTELSLHDNKIGDDGAVALGEALISHDKITVLLLNDNQIGDKGIIKIANALKGKTQLTDLWVHNNKIGDDGAAALGDALIFHDRITDLGINANQIGDKGVINIANALKGKTQLATLWADNNKIGDDGAVALGEALISHDKLTILFLNKNQIGDKGIIKIANALKGKTQLATLWADNNKIGDDGAVALADSLSSHRNLIQLDICNNNISNALHDKLKSLVKSNQI